MFADIAYYINHFLAADRKHFIEYNVFHGFLFIFFILIYCNMYYYNIKKRKIEKNNENI